MNIYHVPGNEWKDWGLRIPCPSQGRLEIGKEAPGSHCCSPETKDALEHIGLTLPSFSHIFNKSVEYLLCARHSQYSCLLNGWMYNSSHGPYFGPWMTSHFLWQSLYGRGWNWPDPERILQMLVYSDETLDKSLSLVVPQFYWFLYWASRSINKWTVLRGCITRELNRTESQRMPPWRGESPGRDEL